MAVFKLRAAAAVLPIENIGIADFIENNVKADLITIADRWDTEANLWDCASTVQMVVPQPPYYAQVALGEGASDPSILGHVDYADLTVQCDVQDVRRVHNRIANCILEHSSAGLSAASSRPTRGPGRARRE